MYQRRHWETIKQHSGRILTYYELHRTSIRIPACMQIQNLVFKPLTRGLFGVLGTKTSFLSFLEPVRNRSQELQTKTNTSNRTRKKSICINQKRMILLDFFLKMLFFSKKLFLNVRFGIFVFVFSSWDLFF